MQIPLSKISIVISILALVFIFWGMSLPMGAGETLKSRADSVSKHQFGPT